MIFITTCAALYNSSGFFIIMSPAEGLHFSALVLKNVFQNNYSQRAVKVTVNSLLMNIHDFLIMIFE